MRAVYKIPVQQKTPIRVDEAIPPISLGKATVTLDFGPINNLINITLEISGVDITFSDDDVIQSDFPELNELAYRLALYLANMILIQTAIEAFEPSIVFQQSPDLIPESHEEEKLFISNPKQAHSSLRCALAVQGRLKPAEIESNLSLSLPISHYADSVRQSSPFQKFEQCYRVVEYFIPRKRYERTYDYDVRLSSYAISHDSLFEVSLIKQLRQTRNRCVHPRANLGHLSPEDLRAIKRVTLYLPIVQRLAHLLLRYPPSDP